MPIVHSKISTKPDGLDSSKIQSTDWNDDHVIDIFVDNETPAGVIDGNNSVFSLIQNPIPSASLKLYMNGTLMKPGVAYNLSSQTITFTSDYIPQIGYILVADYRKA